MTERALYTAALEPARKLIAIKSSVVHVTQAACLKFVFKNCLYVKKVPVQRIDGYHHKSTDYSYEFLPQSTTCGYTLDAGVAAF